MHRNFRCIGPRRFSRHCLAETEGFSGVARRILRIERGFRWADSARNSACQGVSAVYRSSRASQSVPRRHGTIAAAVFRRTGAAGTDAAALMPADVSPTQRSFPMNQYERIARFEAVLKLRDLRRRQSRHLATFVTLLGCLAVVGCL